VIADDWKVMRADLIRTEESIKTDLNTFSSIILKVINDEVSRLQSMADELRTLQMETKAEVKARTPF